MTVMIEEPAESTKKGIFSRMSRQSDSPLGRPPTHRPNGEAYEYTTVNTFVLTWMIERITGKPFAEAVSEMIWRKIGAESDAVLMVSKAGASSTINSTLRDLARFGLLFTPSWQKVSKERLVSEAYLKRIQKGGRPEIFAKATAGSTWNAMLADDPPTHNTYQWDFVMPDGDFFKSGHCGQGLHPLQPGAMRGDEAVGLKKRFPSSPPPGRARGKTSMKLDFQ